jgi:Probable lipoprotein LpqN
MFSNTGNWRVLAGGLTGCVAAGIVAVFGFAGTTATADPNQPLVPGPAPVTVTQTVTVAPTPLAATPLAATPAPQVAASQPEVPTTVVAQPATQPVQDAHPKATTTTAPTPVLVPASSGTLTDYLREKGVALEPQHPRDFRALNITLSMPTGWTQVPDPNVPDAFAVIADRTGGDGLYTSNAQIVVYKLVGDFAPDEAITHGFVDSQSLPTWQSTNASLAAFGGFPSSLIEGTYRQNDNVLNTSRRHVIATAGADRYLVSLAVTTSANQAVATANATDAIVNGFRVADPAAAAPATAHAVTPAAPGPTTVPPSVN